MADKQLANMVEVLADLEKGKSPEPNSNSMKKKSFRNKGVASQGSGTNKSKVSATNSPQLERPGRYFIVRGVIFSNQVEFQFARFFPLKKNLSSIYEIRLCIVIWFNIVF